MIMDQIKEAGWTRFKPVQGQPITEKDIKNMYYKLCYEYHPDRTGGMHQDKFKEITNAYQVIGDKEKKK